MDKKGIYFTTISVILVGIVILSYAVYNLNRTRDIVDLNSVRIETMNSFFKLLQDKEFEKRPSRLDKGCSIIECEKNS